MPYSRATGASVVRDAAYSAVQRRIERIAERVHKRALWGHSSRGLVWNPIFALLPLYYLHRLERSTTPPSEALWLLAFLLGFPHAGYTAMEVRHYTELDGVAGGRTCGQLLFFSGYLVMGLGLSTWYVTKGGWVLAEKTGLDARPVRVGLTISGAVGAVVGVQDVLVMDLVLRPGKVLRAAIGAVADPRLMWVAWGYALLQLAVAESVVVLTSE